MHTSPGAPSKTELRQTMRAALRALPAEQILAGSTRIVSRLADDSRWRGVSGPVALFGGLPGEPELLPLMPWLQERGIAIAFFAARDSQLVPFCAKTTACLRRNPLGFWEPDPSLIDPLPPDQLAVVLVPGLAFARQDGARLGRGAGFYDRFFARPDVAARRIGVAFDLQVVDRIPTDSHDAAMHELATESGWIRFK